MYSATGSGKRKEHIDRGCQAEQSSGQADDERSGADAAHVRSTLSRIGRHAKGKPLNEVEGGNRSTYWMRWTMASVGVACVGLGAVGVILPGMPTTIFLIAACYLFARSHPPLERALVRNRFFARYLPFVDGRTRLSRHAKISILILIWGSTAISCGLLYWWGVVGWPPIALVVGLNAIGTAFIARS